MKEGYEVVPITTLKRLPEYLKFLYKYLEAGNEFVSCRLIGEAINQNFMVVKKDLTYVSTLYGKPRVGFNVNVLIKDIETFFGYNKITNVVLIGCGKLGKTLLSYSGFSNYGLNIAAVFDSDDKVIGTKINNKQVLSIKEIKEIVKKYDIKIGIITVPELYAQEVCDILVETGIIGIWNFAPTHIKVPEGVHLQNEDLGASLALMVTHMKTKKSLI